MLNEVEKKVRGKPYYGEGDWGGGWRGIVVGWWAKGRNYVRETSWLS
jgi:hypothetical protein